MLYEKHLRSTSRCKTIKLPFWYHESVRNSVIAGVISSQTSISDFARVFGYLIFISIAFYDFISSFSP